MGLNNEDMEILAFSILCFGYKVNVEELSEFLKDKKIDVKEKDQLIKERLKKSIDIVSTPLKSEKKTNTFITSKTLNEEEKKIVKNKLEKLINDLGYNLSKEEMEKGLSNLSDECLYSLYQSFDGNRFFFNKNSYKFTSYFIESFFSIVDFFCLKKQGIYDEIVNQKGELYFRIKPKGKCLEIDDLICYECMYELVEYNGKKYLIRRYHGRSLIVYVTEETFKSEFKDKNSYLQTFEKVCQRGYRTKKYEGIDKQYNGQVAPVKQTVWQLNVLYKNNEMILEKTKSPGCDIFDCSISQGEFYTDNDWEYVPPKKQEYVSLSLEEAINEVAYGKKN